MRASWLMFGVNAATASSTFLNGPEATEAGPVFNCDVLFIAIVFDAYSCHCAYPFRRLGLPRPDHL